MEARIAAISIIVEDANSVERLNAILHDYGQYMLGRFGIPYHSKGISIICVVMEAPQDKISAMSGKIGRLNGVTAKATYSNVKTILEE